jgi:cysteine desulfurase/selenocysteine lyase
MVSNALGTINFTQKIIETLKNLCPKIHILLDGAQAVAHCKIDVQKLGCSAFAFSGHKLFGPTGTGILYVRRDLHESFSPVFGGGDMIKSVELAGSQFAPFPALLEAGTPNIAGFIGLGAAIRYFNSVGLEKINALEDKICSSFQKLARCSKDFSLVGNAQTRIPVFSFEIKGLHPHDLASVLDRYGIAIRSGHHCAQPLMRAMKVTATARASLSFYNTESEVQYFFECLDKAKAMLQ